MIYNCMTSKVRNARLQLAENVLNELSPMLLRRARNKAMGIARAEKEISKDFKHDAKYGYNFPEERLVKKAISKDFEDNYKKKAGQAKNLNKGMVKRRKQLKAVANKPNKPKNKVDDLPPTPDDVMRAKAPFERGSGRHMNRGRQPVDPESEN